ncbi:MAG TPA: uroporphyrinogen decarboxylase family protein [Oscillospiraceae bacterium]|nr:uroporphyrinogen decarboxylase family protein [Oscillospiraceae bacterium]HPF56160.1 uroporphyrinogen decarboxylase family protein [Clostridiales bacterium]HPK35589.1 uroporphyrinogen decarboxylase family protein [Oscillospiraceae bacterium]HPR75874.1 uroporphyrinogen decarboxylase family protein [Oscillospiraceae bacterium]
MNSRERVVTVLKRGIPDRVPVDLSWGFSAPYRELFFQKTGQTDYMRYFGVDTEFANSANSKKPNDYSSYFGKQVEDALFSHDEWGIGHQKTPNGGHFSHIVSPLKNAETLNEILDYPLPDLDADYRLSAVQGNVEDIHQKSLAASAPLACTLFETAWQIRGFEELIMDLLDENELSECLIDRIMAIREKQIKAYVHAGADVMMFGDDIGMQTGMMLSPNLWRTFFKPRMAKLIKTARIINPDIPVFYHSDGDIREVIPDLIEIGVTVLNPVQPECMDPAEIKRLYGDKLAFWGSISVQQTLPFGTPEDVKNEVKLRMETIGKDGGFLIGPSHMIEPEVPWENLLAFFEAVEKYGRY